MNGPSSGRPTDIGPVLGFLRARTPADWIDAACRDVDLILLDHASLELKAAQQAQRLIWKYGTRGRRGRATDTGAGRDSDAAFRSRLVNKMSRLAREELRHFEQVVAEIERRGGRYAAIPPARYAARLHAEARSDEPGALVDALIIGAIIEARSCERFAALLEPLAIVDAGLAAFYASLLRAEARHFEDYLGLARTAAGADIAERIATLLARDAELVESPDTELRFLSGPPSSPTQAAPPT